MAQNLVTSSQEQRQAPLEVGQTNVCEDVRCLSPSSPVWHCVDCDSSYCGFVRVQLCSALLSTYSVVVGTAGHFKDLIDHGSVVETVYLTSKVTRTSSANWKPSSILRSSRRTFSGYTARTKRRSGSELRAKGDNLSLRTMAGSPR